MERKRAWLYCRTAKPDDAGSLDYQLFCIRNLARSRGYEIVGETTEYETGRDMNRSGLLEVTSAVTNGHVDVVVVQNLSRIGRRSRDIIKYHSLLKEHGVEFVSVNEISMADAVEEWHYRIDELMGNCYKLMYGVDAFDFLDNLDTP